MAHLDGQRQDETEKLKSKSQRGLKYFSKRNQKKFHTIAVC